MECAKINQLFAVLFNVASAFVLTTLVTLLSPSLAYRSPVNIA